MINHILSLLMCLAFSHVASGQVKYEGTLIIPGQVLVSQFTIDSQQVFLSVPAQGLDLLKAEESKVTLDSITASWSKLNAVYKGAFANDSIVGELVQNGFALKLNLARVEELTTMRKPQEPMPPYNYIEDEVSVWNEIDSIMLAGTLTLPKDTQAIATAIMITGSGPQDRDEFILGHRPFKVIADHLTNNGVAVLRMDDRGVAKSNGDFQSATSEDFKNDILAGVRFLQNDARINPKTIGLIGHSEGGMIAPMAAIEQTEIAFVILLAGPGVTGAEVLIDQNIVIFEKSGLKGDGLETFEKHFSNIVNARVSLDDFAEFENVVNEETTELFTQIKPAQRLFFGGERIIYANGLINFMKADWARYFLAFDPSPFLSQMRCPVLALNGAKDVQITPDLNLSAMEKIFESTDHPDYTTKLYPELNHLFQTANTGMPGEYGSIEETISPEVLNDMLDWIKFRF